MKRDTISLPYPEEVLARVSKPGRYLGSEVGAAKEPDEPALRVALAFPDLYEVGMSHLGVAILYSILRKDPRVSVARVFAPWPDMEAQLRENDLRLGSLESATPLREFDVIGFSLLYELTYTNLLNILDLAGVPLFATERKEGDPIVIAGGPSCYNPEPLAEFLDVVALGDGEGFVRAMAETAIAAKEKGLSRAGVIAALGELPGAYLPGRYRASYGPGGEFAGIEPQEGAPERVARAVVGDISAYRLPERPVVPWVAPIHDRLSVEVARGCTRGCRFCHAGMIYRPVRERPPEEVIDYIEAALSRSGYDEVSLLSLSVGDYCSVGRVIADLIKSLGPDGVAVSLPSLRVGTLSPEIVEEIVKVRKTGFTLAPEAGSERLRKVINKQVSDEDLLGEVRCAFEAGWKLVKLYFMVGLPTETEEDLAAMVELCRRVNAVAKEFHAKVNVSVSTFVPKPHTPFQWHGQANPERVRASLSFLKKRLRGKGTRLKHHDPDISFLEAVFARGDRRLSRVLLKAFELGCRFDGWTEMFDMELWERAFADTGVDPFHYALNDIPLESPLPWDHIDAGVDKEFLWDERQRGLNGEPTPDCREHECHLCGACDFEEVAPRLHPGAPAAKEPEPQEEPAQEAAPFMLVYEKTGATRFLSHLETRSCLLRALRRSGWPVDLTRGFHPKPRVSFGDALPVGMESLEERAVVWLLGPVDTDGALAALNRELPPGLFGIELRALAGKKGAGFEVVHYLVRLPHGLDPREVADALAPKGGRVEERVKSVEVQADGTLEMALFGQARPLKILEEAAGLTKDLAGPARVTITKRE